MFYISEEEVIGEGRERKCYSVPGQRELCIKITKDIPGERLEQSLVEYDYYQYLYRKKVPFDYIPHCYGWVDTNLGKGLLFERVISGGSDKSISLRHALDSGLLDAPSIENLLSDLHSYLFRYGIAVSDLTPSNIVCSFDEKNRMYVIDGLGSRNMSLKYRVRKRFDFYSRYKIKQQWPLLINRVYNLSS